MGVQDVSGLWVSGLRGGGLGKCAIVGAQPIPKASVRRKSPNPKPLNSKPLNPLNPKPLNPSTPKPLNPSTPKPLNPFWKVHGG